MCVYIYIYLSLSLFLSLSLWFSPGQTSAMEKEICGKLHVEKCNLGQFQLSFFFQWLNDLCSVVWQTSGRWLACRLGLCAVVWHLLRRALCWSRWTSLSGEKELDIVFSSNFLGTSGISRPIICFPWASRDIPNFLAPPSPCRRSPPYWRIFGPKSSSLCSFFLPEFALWGDPLQTPPHTPLLTVAVFSTKQRFQRFHKVGVLGQKICLQGGVGRREER